MNNTEESKPIKSNKNIQPLSREHHFGLLFCWKVRTALNHNIPAERIIPYIVKKMNGDQEEEVLIRGKYIIACDGAGSIVRHALQIPLCDGQCGW